MAKPSDQEMVSDHAMVRWLERVEGYDVEEIRQDIIKDGREPYDTNVISIFNERYGISRSFIIYRMLMNGVREAVLAGASKISIGPWSYIILNKTIVTVSPRNSILDDQERRRRRDQRSLSRESRRYAE